MYASRHLPHEHHRRPPPSVEETPSQSVRSLRDRFENKVRRLSPASAPTTPYKKRPPRSRTQTKTQADLAAFLKTGKTAPPPSPAQPSATANVGSLIEKFSLGDRQPLAERHARPLERLRAPHTPDTFGSFQEHDHYPKTDPGRWDSYANRAIQPGVVGAASAAHPITADQTVREIVTKGMQPSARDLLKKRKEEQRRLTECQLRTARDHDLAMQKQAVMDQHPVQPQPPPPPPPLPPPKPDHMSPPPHAPCQQQQQQQQQQQHPPNHPTPPQPQLLQQISHISPASQSTEPLQSIASPLDSEPLSTPDSNPHAFESQPSSDWGAADVYIRQLFAEAEDTAERAVHCDENEKYFEAFELYWVVVELYYKVIPFLAPEEGHDVHVRIKMYTRRCAAIREAFDDDPEGQDEIDLRIQDAAAVTAQKEEQIQENFTTGAWNSQPDMDNTDNENMLFPSHPNIDCPTPQERKLSEAHLHIAPLEQHKDESRDKAEENYELQRNHYPDFYNEKPLAAIPEAPQGHLSASTRAHRNSLSRPISRSAVRASTSSVSRERVAEMQERVNLMQRCLNDFTVKRKHLGPARALELHVTTLNANTFGDLKKLEPLAPDLEHKWAAELEVLLAMLQEIKEVRPGTGYVLRQDIEERLPALEKCDRSIRATMRSFSALGGHVKYVERETAENASAKGARGRRRWWVKVPVVEQGGLPTDVFQVVQEAEKDMKGVFKICHEINVEVVKSMPVPDSFVQALPKHARAVIPRELKEGLTTWNIFKVSDYMRDRNLWSKDASKEMTSSLEKVSLIWEQKTLNKSFLSRTLDLRGDKVPQAMNACRRCQNAIRDLRREWPTMQHTDLDMAKIQNNEDIGMAGLEAYSRALESRAYRLLTRIRELLEADDDEKGKGNMDQYRNR